MEDTRCGGWSDPKSPISEEQRICNELKQEVEYRTGKIYCVFTATLYISQVVAGVNKIIKVHVGEDDYIHVEVFVPLPCHGSKPQLTDVKTGFHKDSPFEIFKPKP
ncbi:cystatin-B-like [Lepisosteus oculatus]|uniref:cystatin-B-like n=1 Tax=Lepisosteus oculatus TaxID=7918 RepID=UPI0035F51089